MAEFDLSLDGRGRGITERLSDLESGTTVRVATVRLPDNPASQTRLFAPGQYSDLEFEYLVPLNGRTPVIDAVSDLVDHPNATAKLTWLDFSSFEVTEWLSLPDLIWAVRNVDESGDVTGTAGRHDVALFTRMNPPDALERLGSSLSLHDLHSNVHESTLEQLEEWWTHSWESGFRPNSGPVPVNEAQVYWVQVESVQGGGETQVEIPRKHMPFFTRESEEYHKGDSSSVILEVAGETDFDRPVTIGDNGMCRPNLQQRAVQNYDLTEYSIVYRYLGQAKDPAENRKPKFTVNAVPDEKDTLVKPFRDECKKHRQYHEMGSGNDSRQCSWL